MLLVVRCGAGRFNGEIIVSGDVTSNGVMKVILEKVVVALLGLVILCYFPAETEGNIKMTLLNMERGSQNISWRRVRAIIVDWFAARTWKINS
jgi:hypothetical protein